MGVEKPGINDTRHQKDLPEVGPAHPQFHAVSPNKQRNFHAFLHKGMKKIDIREGIEFAISSIIAAALPK